MPLQYRGVVSEHNAVRSSCGLFDVSHLGKLRISGRDAEPALQEALTADVGALDRETLAKTTAFVERGGVLLVALLARQQVRREVDLLAECVVLADLPLGERRRGGEAGWTPPAG